MVRKFNFPTADFLFGIGQNSSMFQRRGCFGGFLSININKPNDRCILHLYLFHLFFLHLNHNASSSNKCKINYINSIGHGASIVQAVLSLGHQ